MKSYYQEDLSFNSFEVALREFEKDPDVKTIVCLLSDISGEHLSYLNDCFLNTKKSLIGGVFPGLIYNSQQKETGAVFIGLDYELEMQLIDLVDEDEVYDQVERLVTISEEADAQSIMVFVDAFAEHKSEFVQVLYENYGNSINYIGGGCGSLDMVSKPAVISNNMESHPFNSFLFSAAKYNVEPPGSV